MSSVSLGESLLSNCCGFAAKQFFCITSGETVKRHLTPLISQIAKERIGAFFAFFFTSSTVPVLSATATCLMGDMLYWTVREIAQTLITLFKTLFFKAKGAVQTLPFKKELVYRIASYAVYFFSMTAWSYFAVGITHQALTFVFREIGKNRAIFRNNYCPLFLTAVGGKVAVIWLFTGIFADINNIDILSKLIS